MKTLFGYNYGAFNQVLQIPDLMRCILDYLDCSTLISLSMSNKRYFGLPVICSESTTVEPRQITTTLLNNESLLLDVNLWNSMVHFYEEIYKKLLTFKYVYIPFQHNLTSVEQHLKFMKEAWTHVCKSRETRLNNNLFIEGTVEKYTKVKELVEKLKNGLYKNYRKVSNMKCYVCDIDRNGRAGCYYDRCLNHHDKLQVNSLRGKTVSKTSEATDVINAQWDRLYHFECFAEVLSNDHVGYQEVFMGRVDPYDAHKVSLFLRDTLWDIKNHRYHVYQCDQCSVLLNEKTIIQEKNKKTNSVTAHFCDWCFKQQSKLKHSDDTVYQKFEVPILHRCTTCKKTCTDVMFWCECCSDTILCRNCIQGFRWFLHKKHTICIVGLSNEKDVKCLETDFSIEDEKEGAFWQRSMNPDYEELQKLSATSSQQQQQQQEEIDISSIIDVQQTTSTKKRKSTKKQNRSTTKRKKADASPKKNNIIESTTTTTTSTTTTDTLNSTDDTSDIDQEKMVAVPSVLEPSSSSSSIENTIPQQEEDSEINTDNMQDSQSDVYEVEKILKSKIIRRKKYFLIKWKGYPDSDNTWEPVENVSDDLILSFNNSQKIKKVSNRRKKLK